MNRKGFAFLILGIVIAVIVGGGFVADFLLRQNLGVGLFDLFKVVAESGSTLEKAPGLDEVKSQIGISAYNDLNSQKDGMVNTMQTAAENIGVINNNTEITTALKAAFGEEYKLYLFSVANISDLQFKVFEWSVQVNNGTITTFQSGMLFENYNVKVQASQDIAYSIFSGNASPEDIIDWAKTSKLKINPITEVTRVINVLPQVMSAVKQ